MGIENFDVKCFGPISLNPEIIKLEDPKIRLIESYPDENGISMVSAIVLSAIEEKKETIIGHVVFEAINKSEKTANLNINMLLDLHIKNSPDDFQKLFEENDIFYLYVKAIQINSEKNKGKGLGKFLLIRGLYCMKESDIDTVVIKGFNHENKTFYNHFGAEYDNYHRFAINTNVVTKYEDYLKEVVGR